MTSETQAPFREIKDEMKSEAAFVCTPQLLMHDFTLESFAWSNVKYEKRKARNTSNANKSNTNNNKGLSDSNYIVSEWALCRQVSSNNIEYEKQQQEELEELKEADNIPSARFGHSSIVIEDNMIVFGGRDRYRYLNDIHVYNIPEQRWVDTFTYEQALQEHITQLHSQNTNAGPVYIAHEGSTENQYSFNNTSENELDEINMEINWPAARCAHSAVEYHNDMYIISGNMNEHNVCASDMWKFSLKDKNWTCLSSCLPFAARKGHSSHILLASQTAQRSKYDMLVTFGGLTCKQVQSSESESSSLSSSQEQQQQHHHLELQHSHSHLHTHEHNLLAEHFTHEELAELPETNNEEEEEVYESVSNEVLLYKFETMCWSLLRTCGEVPCGRFYHSAQIVDGTTLLLVFGGRTKMNEQNDNNENSENSEVSGLQLLENHRRSPWVERVLNDLYILDISTGMWRNVNNTSTALLHKVLQCNPINKTKNDESSNIINMEKEEQNYIWPPPRKCATSVCANGKFVILSGINDLHECCNDGYEFDCYTQEWRHFKLGHQPACSCPTVVHCKNCLLLFGGYAAEQNQFVNSIHELVLPPLSLRNSSLLWLRTVMLHEALFSSSQRTQLQCCNSSSFACSPSSSSTLWCTKPSNNLENKSNNVFGRRSQSEYIALQAKENFQLTRSYTEPVYYGVSEYDATPSISPAQSTNHTNNNKLSSSNIDSNTVQTDHVNVVNPEGRSRAREYCVYGNDNNFMHFTPNGRFAPNKNAMSAYTFNPHFMHNCSCSSTHCNCKRANELFRDYSAHTTSVFHNYNSKSNDNNSAILNNCTSKNTAMQHYNKDETQQQEDNDDNVVPFKLTRAYTEPITNSNLSNNNNIDNNVLECRHRSKENSTLTLPSLTHEEYKQVQFLQHQERWCRPDNRFSINYNRDSHSPQAVTNNERTSNFVLSRAATEGNFMINSYQPACTCTRNVNNEEAFCKHQTKNLPLPICVPSPLNPPPPYFGDDFFPYTTNRPKFPLRQHTRYNMCATHQPCTVDTNVNNNYCGDTNVNTEINNEFDYGVYGLDNAFCNIADLPPTYHSQMGAFSQYNAWMTYNNKNNTTSINNKQSLYEREKNEDNALLITQSHTFTSADITHDFTSNSNRYCKCTNWSRENVSGENIMSDTYQPIERSKSENVFSLNNSSIHGKCTWMNNHNDNSSNNVISSSKNESSRKMCKPNVAHTKHNKQLPQFHELLSGLQGANGPYALQNALQSLSLMKATTKTTTTTTTP